MIFSRNALFLFCLLLGTTLSLKSQDLALNLTPADTTLFLNCANPVSFDARMPSGNRVEVKLKDTYGQKVKIDGFGASAYKVTPSLDKMPVVKLAVKSDDGKIDEEISFKVTQPPVPGFQMKVDTRRYSSEEISGSSTPGKAFMSKKSRLEILVVPDEAFAENYPGDIGYRVGAVTILAKRPKEKGAAKRIAQYEFKKGNNTINGLSFKKLKKELSDEPEGTTVWFVLDEIYRINFEDREFPVEMPREERFLAVKLK